MPWATDEEIIENFLSHPLGEINADDVAAARARIEKRKHHGAQELSEAVRMCSGIAKNLTRPD